MWLAFVALLSDLVETWKLHGGNATITADKSRFGGLLFAIERLKPVHTTFLQH